MQPSRRAFLVGRRVRATPWSDFCARIERGDLGPFTDLGASDGIGQGHLAPARAVDVALAQALCAEFGVTLGLDDGREPSRPLQPALYIDPSRLTGLIRLASGPGEQARWMAQPGCLLGDLQEAGLTQFAAAPATMTLAIWLARPHPELRPGACQTSGILSIDALLGDGASESLGRFDADATQPLQSATMQRLVPALFQLAARAGVGELRARAAWPSRFRLDALLPEPQVEVNLSHLLLGHGGVLAWIERAILTDAGALEPQPAARDEGAGPGVLFESPDWLDAEIKSLFDPTRRFPSLSAAV